eukprot:TRINITY_DN14372_c0_g1_i1.p1 TRINITY_DN14372_c0_g1~~TRINITY_DN14372_c0_g1_i1.p1  ORF type:complete len:446 (+),score=124.67 TRINITY_DN14372_c0_g1_i1:65-1402(+)
MARCGRLLTLVALPAVVYANLRLEIWSGVTDTGGACQAPTSFNQSATVDYSVTIINQTSTTDAWVLPTADQDVLAYTTHFLARWTGYLFVEVAGTYMFSTESDDSSWLMIDDATMVNNGPSCRSSSAVQISADTNLTVGWHKLEAALYQYTGSSAMIVKYKGPDTSEEEVVIPAAALYESPWKPTGLSSGPIGRPVGNDFRQPARTLTRRWISFHPTLANFGETVKFTFTGFWATSMAGKMRVRLTESEDCVPVYVKSGTGEKLQQLTISSNRTATFLLPSTANQAGSVGALGTAWAGGFCFYINERWQHMSQPLVVQTPPASTASLMRGFQSCTNFVHKYTTSIPGLCGCFFENMMDLTTDFSETRFYPSTVSMGFDNHKLSKQNVQMNLNQGCCNRWTRIRESFTLADTSTGQRQVWGYCAGKTGATAATDFLTPAPTTISER